MGLVIEGLTPHRGKTALGLAVACGFALWLARGCGADDGLGLRYPVRGRVMYRSQPLEVGRITFHPIDTTGPARDATGTIQGGYYSLSTIGNTDGAFPGRYRVTIVARLAESSKVQPFVKGGFASPFDVIKHTRQARNLIPSRYRSSRLSPLIREVKAETNQFDIELED